MDFSWLFDFGDPTMWVTLALLVFFGGVLYMKIPAITAKALDARADKIREEMDQARLLRDEAQELLASYTRKQRKAEKEAEQIIAQAKKEAKLYATDMRNKLSEQLDRRAEAASRRIEQAEAQAQAMVRDRAVDLAVKAAEIALDTAVPKAAKSKLIDNGIKEMTTGL